MNSRPLPTPKGETKAGPGFSFRGRKGLSIGIYSSAFLLIMLISSCEKDFNINQKGVSNEMAVNSLFNDGTRVQVFLTQPYPAGAPGNNITAITNARMELYENNVFKEVMQYVPSDTQNAFGSYLSVLLPQQGKTYTIKTTAPGYAEAVATDTVPVAAQLITSGLQKYVLNTSKPTGVVNLVFRDDPAVQNYYRINVWINGTEKIINKPGDTSYVYQSNAQRVQVISPVSDTVRDGDFFLFSDKGFNGQEKTLQLSFPAINPYYYVNMNVSVELHTVSYSHYEYFKTLNLWRGTNSSDEPVFIYSNVNNGFGDFVAEHIQPVTFVIK